MRRIPANLIVARVFVGRGVFLTVNSMELEHLRTYDQNGDAVYELVDGVKVHGFAALQSLYAVAAAPRRRSGKLAALLPTDAEFALAGEQGLGASDLYERIRQTHPEAVAGLKTDPNSKGRNRQLMNLLRDGLRRASEESKI